MPSTPRTGTWSGRRRIGSSFAPTTVAGGMTFNGLALDGNLLTIREASDGRLLKELAMPAPIWSGIATVGDSLVTGLGSSYAAQPAGVAALTPGGGRPVAGSR